MLTKMKNVENGMIRLVKILNIDSKEIGKGNASEEVKENCGSVRKKKVKSGNITQKEK